MNNYSEFLTTLHDEKKPVGNLGCGAHYSVLRTAAWFDSCRLHLEEPKAHDFAIIWDKDHNESVIDVVEHMYQKNLLAPVLFIGERKGRLSVIVSQQYKEMSDRHDYDDYVSSVVELAKNKNEPWTAAVCVFGEIESDHQIMDLSQDHVERYLGFINDLWGLGLKDFGVYLNKPDLLADPLLIDTIL